MAVAVGAEVAALQVVAADSRVVAATPAVGAVVVAEIKTPRPAERATTYVSLYVWQDERNFDRYVSAIRVEWGYGRASYKIPNKCIHFITPLKLKTLRAPGSSM